MLSRWTACIPMMLRIATHLGAFFSFQTIGSSISRRGVERSAAKLLIGERRAGTRMISRSEEHTSELQSLMRISYAVFCLKKKKEQMNTTEKENYSTHHSSCHIQNKKAHLTHIT